MSLRVVFDTNVLFSAIGWRGKPAQCLDLVQSGQISEVICVEIVEELAEKLALKLGFTDEQIDTVIVSLLNNLQLQLISGTLSGAQPDPKDDMILECAVMAHATHIVTGDKKHLLPLKEFRGVRIITAVQLLEEVASSNPPSE